MRRRDAQASEARSGVTRLVRNMTFRAMPLVDRELLKWASVLDACPDAELKRQALASMRHKRFHAIGGSVYAIEPRIRRGLVSLIVAYQTISDYLDNLCDRAGVEDADAFRQLHQSMLDAVTPPDGQGLCDYYKLYPRRLDGGYLQSLVAECRRQVSRLPSYAAVMAPVRRLAALYCDLQVYKHARTQERVPLLTAWFERERRGPDTLYWWEFAAACGSTLGIFSLFSLAAREDCSPDLVTRVCGCYFPWICGLHILLDYLIDQGEDVCGGDLNLVSFYPGPGERSRRLGYFLDMALACASTLPPASFHQGVVKGLLALYLSDPKARSGVIGATARELLAAGGRDARVMWTACRVLRGMRLL